MGNEEKLHQTFKRIESIMRELYKTGEANVYIDRRKREIRATTTDGTWKIVYEPKE